MRNIRYLALLLFALLTATACSDDDNGSGNNNKKGIRNTVVMYVSAENSLGYQKFHNSDSTEIMAGSQFLNSRDQMIMYVDDAQNPRIYRIYKGCRKPQLLKKFSTNLCSSDPETLRELLSWVKQTYPSERYGLVMWSHADGWLPSWNTDYKSSKSFGIDVGTGGDMKYDTDSRFRYGASMEIEDLARAVSESGMRPQYIFFDACLMQCIEVDYALRDVTDYVVACPISTPAIGANYTTLMRDGLFTGNPEDIAEKYFSYITSLPLSNVYSDFGLVISCVKTSELENLAAETRKYISKIKAYGDDVSAAEKNYPDMSNVMNYSPYMHELFCRPHYYDLNAAMKKMLPSYEYMTWKTQLDKCIVYKNASSEFFVCYDRYDKSIYLDVDLDNYCGISAFIPQEIYTRNANECIFGDLNEEFRYTEWYKDAGWEEALW